MKANHPSRNFCKYEDRTEAHPPEYENLLGEELSRGRGLGHRGLSSRGDQQPAVAVAVAAPWIVVDDMDNHGGNEPEVVATLPLLPHGVV